MGWFSKRSPEESFWEWFVKCEAELFSADPRSPIFGSDLSKRLKRVHNDLVWQVSMAGEPIREFIISADGLKSGADAVEKLADAAPLRQIPRWKIIRFRPRTPDYASTSIGIGAPDGQVLRIGADQMDVVLTDHEGLADITLYIEGCPEPGHPAFAQVAFLFLDMAIGEYDMICRVGPVTIMPRSAPAPASTKKIPSSRLREEFDRMFG